MASTINNKNAQTHMKLLVIAILVPYFLFNVGLVNEIAENFTDATGVRSSDQLNRWNSDTSYFNEREVSGAEWITGMFDEGTIIAGDCNSDILLSFWTPVLSLSREDDLPEEAYIYLRTWNIERQEVVISPGTGVVVRFNIEDDPGLSYSIDTRSKIYDNGGAQVFAPR